VFFVPERARQTAYQYDKKHRGARLTLHDKKSEKQEDRSEYFSRNKHWQGENSKRGEAKMRR